MLKKTSLTVLQLLLIVLGKPIKVLNDLEESGCNSFTINLDEGKYVLLAVAKWLDNKNNNNNNKDNNDNKVQVKYVCYNYRIRAIN
jgi:hypothetical protein